MQSRPECQKEASAIAQQKAAPTLKLEPDGFFASLSRTEALSVLEGDAHSAFASKPVHGQTQPVTEHKTTLLGCWKSAWALIKRWANPDLNGLVPFNLRLLSATEALWQIYDTPESGLQAYMQALVYHLRTADSSEPADKQVIQDIKGFLQEQSTKPFPRLLQTLEGQDCPSFKLTQKTFCEVLNCTYFFDTCSFVGDRIASMKTCQMGNPDCCKLKISALCSPPNVLFCWNAANKILSCTEPGDTLVIFGNTPYLVGHTLQHMMDKGLADKRHLIFFPFSGSPNRPRYISARPARPNPYLAPELVQERPSESGLLPCDFKDYVTSERLEHLHTRMETAGIWPANTNLKDKTLHFVDLIGLGWGVGYTIRELSEVAKELSRPMPKTHICCLNAIDISNPKQACIAEASAHDGDKTTVCFPSRFSPQHISVPATVCALTNYRDLADCSEAERLQSAANPCFWQKEFDHLYTHDREFSPSQKCILEYFNHQLDHLFHDTH